MYTASFYAAYPVTIRIIPETNSVDREIDIAATATVMAILRVFFEVRSIAFPATKAMLADAATIIMFVVWINSSGTDDICFKMPTSDADATVELKAVIRLAISARVNARPTGVR